MTEHTPDITTGFIQMVEAFKAKPELEAKISELQGSLSNRESEAERRERRIADLEASLASASADKERLTRERDEAMFRTLELEEKTSAVNDLLAQLTRVVHPEPVAKDTHEDQSGAGPTHLVGNQAYDGGFQGLPPSSGSNVESFPRPEYSGQGKEHEPNAEQRSTIEKQYPNWDNPAKSEQNSSETNGSASESMASSNVSEAPSGPDYSEPAIERRPNKGKPYSEKPYWVSDANWRAEGGQGPYENGSWTAPWADHYGS